MRVPHGRQHDPARRFRAPDLDLDQLLDRRQATPAAGPGRAGVPDVARGASPLPHALTNRPITDTVAMANEQGISVPRFPYGTVLKVIVNIKTNKGEEWERAADHF